MHRIIVKHGKEPDRHVVRAETYVFLAEILSVFRQAAT
jgi:hypothetical protein